MRSPLFIQESYRGCETYLNKEHIYLIFIVVITCGQQGALGQQGSLASVCLGWWRTPPQETITPSPVALEERHSSGGAVL